MVLPHRTPPNGGWNATPSQHATARRLHYRQPSNETLVERRTPADGQHRQPIATPKQTPTRNKHLRSDDEAHQTNKDLTCKRRATSETRVRANASSNEGEAPRRTDEATDHSATPTMQQELQWHRKAIATHQRAHRGIAAQRVTILFNRKVATHRPSPRGRERVLHSRGQGPLAPCTSREIYAPPTTRQSRTLTTAHAALSVRRAHGAGAALAALIGLPAPLPSHKQLRCRRAQSAHTRI